MRKSHSFSRFIDEPVIALSILTIGLVALLLSVLEFARAIS
ncbi:MAG TPA: hypothetical protein VLE91_04150 [Candidatus Saccharimonadales bacterium]|nr:hypothetical protein [Candidatus Saccharimonadales bacterium]